MKLRLSDTAKTHIEDIRVYTIYNFGVRQWLVYSGAIEAGLSTLRRFPEIGIEHVGLSKKYRAFRVRRHWICYQLGNQTIEILGIVQDVDQLTETTSKI